MALDGEWLCAFRNEFGMSLEWVWNGFGVVSSDEWQLRNDELHRPKLFITQRRSAIRRHNAKASMKRQSHSSMQPHSHSSAKAIHCSTSTPQPVIIRRKSTVKDDDIIEKIQHGMNRQWSNFKLLTAGTYYWNDDMLLEWLYIIRSIICYSNDHISFISFEQMIYHLDTDILTMIYYSNGDISLEYLKDDILLDDLKDILFGQ